MRASRPQKKTEEERLAQARAETAARDADRRRRDAAEAAAAKQRKEVAAEQGRRALALEAVRRSPAYTELRTQAGRVATAYRLELIGEDSAYRGMSRGAGAVRDLLAIHVKIEAMLHEQDVSAAVDRVVRESEP